MPIFKSKNNKSEEKNEKAEVQKSVKKSIKSEAVEYGVIRNPRITEKATMVSEFANIYTFDVSPRANERAVKKAIKDLYGVNALKVNFVTVRGKKVYSRGIEGKRASGKKAYVFLKKGDKIEFA
jgi:large subunit ribosomal protein L23